MGYHLYSPQSTQPSQAEVYEHRMQAACSCVWHRVIPDMVILDHTPLEQISLKCFTDELDQILWMFLHLQGHDFQLRHYPTRR